MRLIEQLRDITITVPEIRAISLESQTYDLMIEAIRPCFRGEAGMVITVFNPHDEVRINGVLILRAT